MISSWPQTVVSILTVLLLDLSAAFDTIDHRIYMTETRPCHWDVVTLGLHFYCKKPVEPVQNAAAEY